MLTKLTHKMRGYHPYGLTIVRLAAGWILVSKGASKVFSGEYAVTFFSQLNIPLPAVMGPFVSFLELIGGVALILGLYTRLMSLLYVGLFVVATYSVAITMGRGFSAAGLPILMLAVSVLLMTNGGGALSMDKLINKNND